MEKESVMCILVCVSEFFFIISKRENLVIFGSYCRFFEIRWDLVI